MQSLLYTALPVIYSYYNIIPIQIVSQSSIAVCVTARWKL